MVANLAAASHPYHRRPASPPTKCTHHVSFERVQTAKAQALGFSLEIVGIAQEQRPFLVALFFEYIGAALLHLQSVASQPTAYGSA